MDESTDLNKKEGPLTRLFGSSGRIRIVEAFLGKRGIELTAAEVAKLAGVDRSTVSRNVDALVETELIERRETESDVLYCANVDDPAIEALLNVRRALLGVFAEKPELVERDDDRDPATEAYVDRAGLVRLFGSPGRVKMIEALLEAEDEELTGTEIADRARIDRSTVSRNIGELVDLELAERTRDVGNSSLYRLVPDHPVSRALGTFRRRFVEGKVDTTSGSQASADDQKDRRFAESHGIYDDAARNKREFHNFEPRGKHDFNRPENREDEVLEVSVQRLDEDAPVYAAAGTAEETDDGYAIDAREVVEGGREVDAVKVIGDSEVHNALTVIADAFTASAVECIEGADGEAVLSDRAERVVSERSDNQDEDRREERQEHQKATDSRVESERSEDLGSLAKFDPDVVIDASDCIMGRVASQVAERAMDGKRVSVVNVEQAVVTGDENDVMDTYRKRLDLVSDQGPAYPKRPDGVFKRAVRSMLPHKTERGREAFKNVNVYVGNPFADDPVTLPDTTLDRLSNIDSVRLIEVAQELDSLAER